MTGLQTSTLLMSVVATLCCARPAITAPAAAVVAVIAVAVTIAVAAGGVCACSASEVRSILEDPAADSLESSTPKFWLMVAALKKFVVRLKGLVVLHAASTCVMCCPCDGGGCVC